MNTPAQISQSVEPVTPEIPQSFYGMVRVILNKGESIKPKNLRTFLGCPQALVKAVRLKIPSGILQVEEYTDGTAILKFDGPKIHDSISFNWGITNITEEVDDLHKVVLEAVRMLTKE